MKKQIERTDSAHIPPANDESAPARGIHVEPGATLCGVLRGGHPGLSALSLVRGEKGDESGAVDAIHLRPHDRFRT